MVRKCSVLHCQENSRFTFPSNKQLRKKWLVAINRPDFEPNSQAGICEKHFNPSDFITEGAYTGVILTRKKLRRGVVPSREVDYRTPTKKSRLEDSSDEPLSRTVSAEDTLLERQESDLGVEELICEDAVEVECGSVEIITDTITEENSGKVDVACGPDYTRMHDVQTQTMFNVAPYTIRDLMFKPEQLNDLTGISSYKLFTLIYQSLVPGLQHIEYRNSKVYNVSHEDQLFLTLWKLRKATTDIELGIHFGIGHTTVSNIFYSFIKFMADQWGKLNLWPSRQLVDYYMPSGFKKQYPSTRVIVDGTEFPIEKPINPWAQQASFSTYKNGNTLKAMVGGTPSGLISYVTECYGGSVSDRQITERSELLRLCQKGDSIMADRGFNVQDLFAPQSVSINIPHFLKGKDHLPNSVIMKDRKLASKRVHIERLIGHTKTYKILQTKLQHSHVSIGSEIFFVCVMLTNFKNNIVSSEA
ncbi:hypothetical protein FOCC_FOCC011923 [Frankliniella occidentalis]|uniref:Uncharacterized protein LOC113209056 n=1 Tax=Frankliniella occidentalis TaxID=133901 RepID=A0A6J1SS75_FRAOC|nr:uncharacterized protein LOC113209056 [Frankliniella occidentalis]KAE8742513.1 hypothetical protein FOCC_FOCC011923 [Frankliniella occidentalis]